MRVIKTTYQNQVIMIMRMIEMALSLALQVIREKKKIVIVVVVALSPGKWPLQDLLPLPLPPILLSLLHLMLVTEEEDDIMRITMMTYVT